MSIHIHQVAKKEDYNKFVQFGIDLYEGNEYFVPPLFYDERDTLNRSKNPAFEHCDAAFFLAYRDDKIVGRIGVIINHKANQIWKQKNARFGFVDFIDDAEVVDALFNTADDWARVRDMEKMHGPLGFCDMDHQGTLVEGFDQPGTMASIYNYPYYVDHLQRKGYIKDQDWLEFLITIPREIPERFARASEIVKKRSGVAVRHLKNKKDVFPYAKEIFKLINLAYKDLYGYVELSEKQIDYYVNMYIPMLRLEFLTLVVREEDNSLIGVGIGLPSLAKALQKAKGKFLPVGWYHLLRAIKGRDNKILDLLLIAVHPDYQGKGIHALVFNEFIPAAARLGFEYAESNPELEVNNKVQAIWGDLETKQTKRRRVFIKDL
jgi:GNAT superfamily N-acetyltransferase